MSPPPCSRVEIAIEPHKILGSWDCLSALSKEASGLLLPTIRVVSRHTMYFALRTFALCTAYVAFCTCNVFGCFSWVVCDCFLHAHSTSAFVVESIRQHLG